MTSDGVGEIRTGLQEQPQRPRRAERLVGLLAQVVHGAAEPRAVAQVLLDAVGEVVDAHVDLADAVADETEDDPVEDGAATDGHQRLRRVLGEVAEARPRAPRHHQGDVRQPLGADDVGEGVQPHDPRLPVDLGHRRDAERPHQVEDQGARRALAHDVRVGCRVREGGVVDGGAGQQGAAHVAVGHHADDPPVVVDQHAHRRRVPVDHLHHLTQRGGVGRTGLLEVGDGHRASGASTKGLARGAAGAARTTASTRAAAEPSP